MTLQIDLLSTLSLDEKICTQHGGHVWIHQESYLHGDFLTLNQKEKSVKWFHQGGNAIFRYYQFQKEPLDAVFCILNKHMITSINTVDGKREEKQLCVAILVSPNELHIYFQSGEKYEMMLPAACKYLLATSLGLLLQGTIFNVIEPILPEESQFQSAETHDTNVVLFLNSPYSSVDIINVTLCDPFSNFVLLSSYYDFVALHSTKGNSLVVVQVEPIQKTEKSLTLNVVDQSLSMSSLLLRSLNNSDSISKSADKSGLLNQSLASYGSKGSRTVNSQGSGSGLKRPPSRSTPSPQHFTSKLSGRMPSPQMVISPDNASNNSGGSNNQYSSDALQNYLGIKRQSSRDQDRSYAAAAPVSSGNLNISRGISIPGSLPGPIPMERSRSLDEIDFTMNTLIDGIYNDILPYNEANVTFRLRCMETLIDLPPQSSSSAACLTDLQMQFYGDLEKGTLLITLIGHTSATPQSSFHRLYRVEMIVPSPESNEKESEWKLVRVENHSPLLSSPLAASSALISLDFFDGDLIQSATPLIRIPVELVALSASSSSSSSGGKYFMNVPGTKAALPLPETIFRSQKNWLASLLLAGADPQDTSSRSWQLSSLCCLTPFLQARNEKENAIGRVSLGRSSLSQRVMAKVLFILQRLFSAPEKSQFMLVVSSLWLKLQFSPNFPERDEFFLFVMLLVISGIDGNRLTAIITQLFPQNQQLGQEILGILLDAISQWHQPTATTHDAEGNLFQFLLSLHLLAAELFLSATINPAGQEAYESLQRQLNSVFSLVQNAQTFLSPRFLEFYGSLHQTLQAISAKEMIEQLIQQQFRFQFEGIHLLEQLKLILQNLFFLCHFFQLISSSSASSTKKPSIQVIETFITVTLRYLMTNHDHSPAHDELDAEETRKKSEKKFLKKISEDLWNKILLQLPNYLRFLIQLALDQSKFDAPMTWPIAILKWMGRNDLCANLTQQHPANLKKGLDAANNHGNNANNSGNNTNNNNNKGNGAAGNEDISDGLAEVDAESILRFPEDDRVHEVCRMLRSSAPCFLKLEKSPEASEMEYRQKQQIRLLTLIRRTLACPVGRGMLTIATMEPLMAEALPIPPLSLSGRVPPANTLVALDISAAHSDLNQWPEFHNGTAAALRVGPAAMNTRRVTRNWIIYNKTASQSKPGGDNAHAGFLLGMGLFGHLNVLTITDICDYLTQGHEPTTIAVLMGVSASKIGTADALLSKTLCLHLPTLLPAQHWDIEISPLTQCSALIGLGFLYCRSGHRLMVQFLLEELSRKPSSDRCECREALALSAAWALAMVLLPSKIPSVDGLPRSSKNEQKSFQMESSLMNTSDEQVDPHETSEQPAAVENELLKSLADLKIEDRLFLLINGGSRPTEFSLFPHGGSNASAPYDTSARSSRILEGDQINRDVTSPGAILALALIHLGSNQPKILKMLELPTTVVELDSLRFDLLIYRSIGRCLVQWSHVQPTVDWIDAQIPPAIHKALTSIATGPSGTEKKENKAPPKYLGPYGKSRHTQQELSAATAFMLHMNIICGYCLGIGVVYAGTFHEEAKNTILSKLRWLQGLRENKTSKKLPFSLDKTHRIMIEVCVSCLSLALSCVMAGSGDLDCLRIIRELRWKVDDVVYGTHLALNMALGMLFLAGGSYSLKRDPISSACLLLSILPRFPSRTVDNQFHLQALRHFYVLAVESRVLHTVDVDTGLPISVDLQLELQSGQHIIAKVPGLLPQLNTVKSISIVTAAASPDDLGGHRTRGELVLKDSTLYFPSHLRLSASPPPDDQDDLPRDEVRDGQDEEVSKAKRLDAENQRIVLPTFYVKKLPQLSGDAPAQQGTSSTSSFVGDSSLSEKREAVAQQSATSSCSTSAAMLQLEGRDQRKKLLKALLSDGQLSRRLGEGEGKGEEPARCGQVDRLLANFILSAPSLQELLVRSLNDL